VLRAQQRLDGLIEARARKYFHLSDQPDNEKAWYNKAMIHYVLGVYDRAQECIGKALDINPGYMPAQKLKCELERVQKWLFKSQHQDWKPNDSAY